MFPAKDLCYTLDMKTISSEASLRTCFFQPLDLALDRARNSRDCTEYPDSMYLHAGVGRVIEGAKRGRQWVQLYQALINTAISVATFLPPFGANDDCGYSRKSIWMLDNKPINSFASAEIDLEHFLAASCRATEAADAEIPDVNFQHRSLFVMLRLLPVALKVSKVLACMPQ